MGSIMNKHIAESQEEMDLLKYIDERVDEVCSGASVDLHEMNIINAYRHCFTNSNEKIHYLNDDGVLNQSSASKFLSGVSDILFKKFFDKRGLRSTIKNVFPDKDDKTRRGIFKSVVNEIGRGFESFLNVKKQRNKIALDRDMFAKKTILKFEKHRVVRIAAHEPFEEDVLTEKEEREYLKVVDDYKEHFPEIEEVLKFITASQFSTNCKYSYLWIKLISDGGKGFFINRLRKLGIVVLFSMEELEDILRGKPSGKEQNDFDNCWALIGDEVKNVKRELKELDNEIRLSAKYSFEFTAKVGAKILFSAEGIATLTEGGVEDQFVNRLAGLSFKNITKINERAVFKELGNALYERYVTRFFAKTLNLYVEEYRQLGRYPAEKKGYEDIESFHNKHKIDKIYGNQKAEIKLIVEELKELFVGGILDIKGHPTNVNKKIIYRSGEETDNVQKKGILITIRSASNYVDNFLRDNYPHTLILFEPLNGSCEPSVFCWN